MNKGIVLVDVIIFLVILIPIVFLIVYTMGRDKKVKKSITKLCKSNGITLDQFEINGNLVLGLDSEHKKLVVSNRKELQSEFLIVDLTTLADCNVKVIKPSKNRVDWVGLELVSFDYKKDIPFYEEDDNDGPAADSKIREQQAIKWEKLIKPCLKAS